MTRKRDVSLRVKVRDLNVVVNLMDDMEDLSDGEGRTLVRLKALVDRVDVKFEEVRKVKAQNAKKRSSS